MSDAVIEVDDLRRSCQTRTGVLRRTAKVVDAATCLPLTHGIAAARELADGAAVSYLEWESRRRATLEMA